MPKTRIKAKGEDQTKNPVLPSTEFLLENPKYVLIDRDRLARFQDLLSRETLTLPDFKTFPFYDKGELSDKQIIDFLCIGSCIDFSFTEPKTRTTYQVTDNGRTYEGSTAMWVRLRQAMDKGIPITSTDFILKMNKGKLAEILQGDNEIPMLRQRLGVLRSTAIVLDERYDGHFHNLLDSSSQRLFNKGKGFIDRLTGFHCFDDFCFYSDETGSHYPRFYAKAQRLAGMLLGRFFGQTVFKDANQLTVCADNKLQAGLKEEGVLVFSDGLDDHIKNKIPIASKSRVELELRASALHACHMTGYSQSGLDDWIRKNYSITSRNPIVETTAY